MPAPPKAKIVEKFNDSVINIEKALESASSQDLNSLFKFIEISASQVYQAIEWAIKSHLLERFSDEIANRNERRIIEAAKFHPKVNLFESSGNPIPSSIGIKVEVIKDLKKVVRNDPEHSGIAPHFESLISVITEARKIIKNYIAPNAQILNLPEKKELRLTEDPQWLEFLNACDSFEKGRNYILITGRNELDNNFLKPFGLIDWNVIFDFDASTEDNGLLHSTKSLIEQRRIIHRVTLGDRVSRLASSKSTYWVHANGSQGRMATEFSSFREWNRHYPQFLNDFIEKAQRTLNPNPTTVVIVCDSANEVGEIIKLLDRHFGNTLKFVYSIPKSEKLSSVISSYTGISIEIEPSKITQGILKIRSYFDSIVEPDLVFLPSKDGGTELISNEDFLWVEEDFEVLHQYILETPQFLDGQDTRESFYKGKVITWKGLQLRYDIEREIETTIIKSIQDILKHRKVGAVYTIYHYPGIGGTTLGRRVAWAIHNNFPVLVLRNYKSNESIDRVYKVFQVTSLPPVILIEASSMPLDEVMRFQSEINSRNFPALFILVQRKNDYTPKKENEIFISDRLTDIELGSFINNYSELVPARRELLSQSFKSRESKEKHPFYLGLLAFEENFLGLQDFVGKNLNESTELQKRILGVISICYYYSQTKVPAQLFTGLLSLTESIVLRLERYLTPGLLHLIINDDELNWRPIHQLVSKEIMNQVLVGKDCSEEVLKYRLVDWSIDFIRMLGAKSYDITDDELFLLKKLFIYRDSDHTFAGDEESEFSFLIEYGLPNDEARLRVFIELTNSFPMEAHFWAHLARFYNFKMKQSEKGLEAIDQAINIVKHEDYSLYHVKGMCYRSSAYRLMQKCRINRALAKTFMPEIISLVEQSAEQFEKCRDISDDNEYGYISQIQLIINYLDFKFTISDYDNKRDFIRRLNVYDLQMLNCAEELLENIQRIYRDQPENYYITKCNAGLDELYVDYSSIIESWTNLLDARKDAPRHLIRQQLVRAYVRRAGDWSMLNGHEIARILSLLEENISIDPKNKQNLYLWFQAAKQTNSIPIEEAIVRLANWKVLQESVDAAYYLGVLHSIQAIDGYSVSRIRADELIRETSEKSRSFSNRSYCFEWYAKGNNLKRIAAANISVTREGNGDFIFDSQLLDRVKGKIIEIKGPEAGRIELDCGLKAFFIPARAENNKGFFKDKDLNRDVSFFLGFSYDGLRAYDIRKV